MDEEMKRIKTPTIKRVRQEYQTMYCTSTPPKTESTATTNRTRHIPARIIIPNYSLTTQRIPTRINQIPIALLVARPALRKIPKPAVPMHIALRIEPRSRVLQKRRHVRLAVVDVVHPELGQVDGTVPADGVRLLDVAGEVAE